MSPKKIFSIMGVLCAALFVVLLMLRFIYGGPEDAWICTGDGWSKHGSPREPMPQTGCETSKKSEEQTSIANPASVFCLDAGGSLGFVADENGEQKTLCIFEDGRQCDEWDFFRTKTCGKDTTPSIPEGIMEEFPTY